MSVQERAVAPTTTSGRAARRPPRPRRVDVADRPGVPPRVRRLRWLVVVFLLVASVVQIAPFTVTVSNSMKCLPAVQDSPQSVVPVPPFGVDCTDGRGATRPAGETSGTLTFNPTTEGYDKIFEFEFGRWFLNSVIFAVGVTALRLVLDSLAGYAFAKLRFRGNRLLFIGILGTMMIPSVVLLIPRFLMLRQLDLLNTYHGVLLTLGVDAFGIFLMKQYFEAIPDELIEAAKIDGAGTFTIFWRVVLPISVPGLTSLAILSFGQIWNNFIDLLVIVGGDSSMLNLPLGLALLRGQFGETLVWNVFLAGSVLTTLPMIILFFVFQRQFVSSNLQAGMKG